MCDYERKASNGWIGYSGPDLGRSWGLRLGPGTSGGELHHLSQRFPCYRVRAGEIETEKRNQTYIKGTSSSPMI